MYKKTTLFLISISLVSILTLSITAFNLHAQNGSQIDKGEIENEPVSIVYDACTSSSGSEKSLDVHVFIDISDDARIAEKNLDEEMRKKILHMIADFLFVDNHLRGEGVNNRFTVWLYSDETRSATVSDFNSDLTPAILTNENSLTRVHNMIDELDFSENESSESNGVNFTNLTDTLVKEASNSLNEQDDRIPVIILLNDMSPNGTIYNDVEAATQVHDELWNETYESIPLAQSVYLYVIDFSFTHHSVTGHGPRELAQNVRNSWLGIFNDLNEPIQGGFRTITPENELLEISRIIEETTGSDFNFLTAAPTNLDLCPFTKEVRFALLFDKPNINHSRDNGIRFDTLIPEPSSGTERGRFSITTSLIPSEERLELSPNSSHQDLDVLYAYSTIGGLSRSILSVCPPDKVQSGGLMAIQWPITDTSSLRAENLRILYGYPNSDEHFDELADLDSPSGIQVLDNSLPTVSEDTEYELIIVNGEEKFTCNFQLVPTPTLGKIEFSELITGQPFTATLPFSHADRIVHWEQLNAVLHVLDTQGKMQEHPVESVSRRLGEVTYVFSPVPDTGIPLEWVFDVELLTKTRDGININIQESQHVKMTLPYDLRVHEAKITHGTFFIIFIIWFVGMLSAIPIYRRNKKRLEKYKTSPANNHDDCDETINNLEYHNLWIQATWILFTISSVLGEIWVLSQQYGSEAENFFWTSFLIVDTLFFLGIVVLLFSRKKENRMEISAFLMEFISGTVFFVSIVVNILPLDNGLSSILTIDSRLGKIILVASLAIFIIVWIKLLADTIMEKWHDRFQKAISQVVDVFRGIRDNYISNNGNSA